MILTEPQEAFRFSNHFGQLYRSILSLRENLMITLREELEFVQGYAELQRIRFK